MAETIISTPKKRYAVVTGANKGIGLEICRQLVSHGITVVLTARDERRGTEAWEKLKESDGLSAGNLIFHRLDVVDPTSISSLADFVKTSFGRLDILVNNAGIVGAIIDGDAFRAAVVPGSAMEETDWSEIVKQTYECAEECVQTNYYGAKRMTEAFVPLLQLSNSPRIVNVSSSLGKLDMIPNEWAKGVLSDPQSLTEERIDDVLNKFLEDFKEGSMESKGWPKFYSAYIMTKAAMNSYTRVVAKKCPNFIVNCVCPGFVKTDLSFNTGTLSVEDGADSPVRLALLPNGGPSGVFFFRSEIKPFE